MSVIDKNGCDIGLFMGRTGNAADIIAITEDKKRKKGDHRVFQGMNRTHEMQAAFFDLLLDPVGNLQPEPFRFKGLFGKVQRECGHEFLGGVVSFLIPGDPFGDLESSAGDSTAEDHSSLFRLNDLSLFIAHRPGEVTALHAVTTISFCCRSSFSTSHVRPDAGTPPPGDILSRPAVHRFHPGSGHPDR